MADEHGRKLLQDLAKTVEQKVAPSGEAKINRRGLLTIELLARELTGPGAIPGIQLWRDAVSKFRLTRPRRNAEIGLEWQRDIGAMVLSCQKLGEPRTTVRYLYDEALDQFHQMSGVGELYEDLTRALVEYLYPEGKK